VSDPSTAGPRPWRRALAWLAFLGPFFFATYGLATWATAQRTGVPSIVFDWERSIPFWPWTIVPYWIIDALYAASLFACSTRASSTPREAPADGAGRRDRGVPRRAAAFSFVPPPVDGVAGAMFGMLRSFDQPFNQLPSLHLALAVILAALFTRKATGIARIAVVAGFVVIGLSVLTTWQHHFIDVPTGVLLGRAVRVGVAARRRGRRPAGRLAVAPHARSRARQARARIRGRRNACRCACRRPSAGGAVGALDRRVARAGRGRVRGLGAGGFQKGPDGRLSLAAQWLYAPYLAGRVGQLACVDAQRARAGGRSPTACSSDACRRRGSWPDRRSPRSST
jgi:hypothetical protein